MKVPPPLPNGLIAIGKGVYLRKPLEKAVVNAMSLEEMSNKISLINQPSPHILLDIATDSYYFLDGFCGAGHAVGAQLPHILKYSNAYAGMYPQSMQVIVRSDPSYFWSSERSKRASLQPVVDALESLACIPPAQSSTVARVLREADVRPVLKFPSPSVLVHTFSNGGAWQLATLSELLSSRSYPPMSKLSPAALVLDSCPGDGGVEGTVKAFSGLVRNPVLRSVVLFVIRFLYFFAAIRRRLHLTRSQSVFDGMKARLNTEKLLPWFLKDTPRLYLFSSKDDVIPYHEVEKHAQQAKDLGLNVRDERFEDSQHVAHARADPERYWSAVKQLWEEAVRPGNTQDTSRSTAE